MSHLSLAETTRAKPTPSSVGRRTLQRKCACGKHTKDGACDACRKKRQTLQRSAVSAYSEDVPTAVHDVLRSPGHPLDAETRTYMESRFGHDLSHVRIHTDGKAAESARLINAKAYTAGTDVVFGAGEYAPHTLAGTHLLAHEVTHVVQQGGSHGMLQTRLVLGSANDVYERQAEKVANSVAREDSHAPYETHEPSVSVVHRTQSTVQRVCKLPSNPTGNVTTPNGIPSNMQIDYEVAVTAGKYCRDRGLREAFGRFPFRFPTGLLHFGKTCYREVPTRTSYFDCPAGDQVCFDDKGICVENSPEKISPVEKPESDDGTCNLHQYCADIGHFFVDVIAVPIWSSVIKPVGSAVWSGAKSVGRAAKAVGRGIWSGMKWLGQKIGEGARAIGRGAAAAGSAIWSGITTAGAAAWEGLKTVGGWLKEVGETAAFLAALGGLAVSEAAKKVGRGLSQAAQFVGNAIEWLGRQLWDKVFGIVQRVAQWAKRLPARVGRLLGGLWEGLKSLQPWSLDWWLSSGQASTWENFMKWFGHRLIELLDIAGVGEAYETVQDFIKFNTRTLTGAEIDKASRVFGASINLDLVRVDEHAVTVPAFNVRAYISFNTINSWGSMTDDTLMHELTHVWQYEQMGSIYMPRALHASFFGVGYDYGGLRGLQAAKTSGSGLSSFNLEQQAQIVMDFYRIKTGLPPKFGTGTSSDLPLYAYFVQEVSTLTVAQLVV